MTEEANRIKEVFERNANVLGVRPALGQVKEVATVRVKSGLTCEVTDGDHTIVVDMPEITGGNNAGPTPSALGRVALGSCLAIGYTWWAAKMNVPLASLEVEVHTEADARGMYAVGDVPAGFTAVRCVVKVQSDAPEAEVRCVLDEADAHSPLMDDFRALPIEREVQISAPAR